MPVSVILICGYLIGLNVLQRNAAHDGRPDVPAFMEENETGAADQTNPGYLIDLNQASAEDLMLLDGIGEALAGRIIKKREELGGFQNIEELKLVRGIGDSTFETIQNYIIVE